MADAIGRKTLTFELPEPGQKITKTPYLEALTFPSTAHWISLPHPPRTSFRCPEGPACPLCDMGLKAAATSFLSSMALRGKLHKRTKRQSLKYHMRIQKKWDKRFGSEAGRWRDEWPDGTPATRSLFSGAPNFMVVAKGRMNGIATLIKRGRTP